MCTESHIIQVLLLLLPLLLLKSDRHSIETSSSSLAIDLVLRLLVLITTRHTSPYYIDLRLPQSQRKNITKTGNRSNLWPWWFAGLCHSIIIIITPVYGINGYAEDQFVRRSYFLMANISFTAISLDRSANLHPMLLYSMLVGGRN